MPTNVVKWNKANPFSDAPRIAQMQPDGFGMGNTQI